jgi:amidohydrolase
MLTADPEMSRDVASSIDNRARSLRATLVALRRHLHAHPEPSGEEFETTRHIARLLDDAGLRTRVAGRGTGLVAEPTRQDEEACIAFRADIDALRVPDEKHVEYRSTTPGVAHACGHDAHATIAVGAALVLDACRDELPWPVRWRAIFQPAEETSTGAKQMVADGAVDRVNAIVGLHLDPERRLGRVGLGYGTLTAYCNEVDVVVRGVGGHAARPHHAADPISAAVQLVSSAYHGLPRAIDSRDPAVLTFGSIHGGQARNVIPEHVRLEGTARTHSIGARETLERRLREIGAGVAATTGTRIDFEFRHGPDAIVNDPTVTAICERALVDALGRDAIEPITLPSLGGEDFSEYLAHVPGCFFRLGTRLGEKPAPLLHSGRFDVPDEALVLGVSLVARCVVTLAREHPGSLPGIR